MYISPARPVGLVFPNYMFYYPFGNTPPCDLFAAIPPNSHNSRILSIGCGDIRSVLFSLWLRGSRNLDTTFVLNDLNPAIIARDILLLILAATAPPASSPDFKGHVAEVWAFWYSMGLTKLQRTRLGNLLEKLISAASSESSWKNSEFSRHVQFYNNKTRKSVLKLWRYWLRQDIPLPAAMLKRRFLVTTKYRDPKLIAGPTSLALIHSLLLSQEVSQDWMTKRADEIEDFLKGEGITQATTLFKCDPSEVVEMNPLLFEDSEEYSMHYGAIPFEGYSHCHLFTEKNWKYSKKEFPQLAKDCVYSQFVADEEFSKNFFLANCTQQFSLWIEHVSRLSREKKGGFQAVFQCGDALEFCDEMATKILAETAPLHFDAIETSNLADHLGLLPILVSCSTILKENGAVFTNSFLSGNYSTTDEDFLSKVTAIPPSIMPSVLGLRCAGLEGILRSESSNYDLDPPLGTNVLAELTKSTGENQRTCRDSRTLKWFKQPANSAPSSPDAAVLSQYMARALYKCAKLCTQQILERNLPGLVQLNVETFVRVLLSLKRSSHTQKWDELISSLTTDYSITPYLHEMQTLLNAHEMDIPVLPFSELGEWGTIPLEWDNEIQFVPVLYIAFDEKRHYVSCMNIEYNSLKIASSLHFLVPKPFCSKSEAQVVLEYYGIDNITRIALKKEFKLTQVLQPSIASGPIVISPVFPQNTKNVEFSVTTQSESETHFDLELSIAPTVLGDNSVSLVAGASKHSTSLSIPKLSKKFPLSFSTPVHIGNSKVSISRKRSVVILKIAKGTYPFGIPIFYTFDNLLAYPAHDILDKLHNPLSGMQFSPKDRSIARSDLPIQEIPAWVNIKDSIHCIFGTPENVYQVGIVEKNGDTPDIHAMLYKHGTRISTITGGLLGDISFCFLEIGFVEKVVRALNHIQKKRVLSVTPSEFELMTTLFPYNASVAKLPPHPDLKGVEKYFTRTFIAPLYPPRDEMLENLKDFKSMKYEKPSGTQKTVPPEPPFKLPAKFPRNPEEFGPFLQQALADPSFMEHLKKDPIYQKMMNQPEPEEPKKQEPKQEKKPSSKTCSVCGKTNAKKCSKCVSVAYCSVDCQRIDWPKHKANCVKKT